MSQSKDFSQEFGLIKEVGNTPTAADLYGGANSPTMGAGNRTHWEELEITDIPEKYKDIGSTGNQFTKNDEVVAVPVSWSGKGDVYVDNTLTEIGCALGFEELSGPVNYDTTKYSHLLSLLPLGKDQRLYTATEAADATANASFSPAYDSGDYINVFMRLMKAWGPADLSAENCAASAFKLMCEAKSVLKFEMSGSGERTIRDTSKTQSANFTDRVGCDEGRFAMRHCTASVGVVGGSATDLSIFGFEINVEMGQAEDLFPSGTQNSGLSRSEPVSTGETLVTGSMTINKHDTIQWDQYKEADTKLFLKFDFAAGDRRFIICLPLINVKEAPVELGDGSKINVSFEAHIPCDADPFTAERSISGSEQTLTYPETPLYIVWSNENSNNVLRQET